MQGQYVKTEFEKSGLFKEDLSEVRKSYFYSLLLKIWQEVN